MPSRSGEVVDKAGQFLQERLHELDQERARIERALSELTGGRIGSRTARARPRRRKAAGRKAAPKKAGTKKAARGGRRGGNTRAAQAVKLVKANPGINASEIARRMKINPNYVYRVMANLEKEGKVKKKGRTYSAA